MVVTDKPMQSKRGTNLKAIAGSLLLVNFCVNAQPYENAASIAFKGVDFTSSPDLAVQYDDNLTQSSNNKTDSWSGIIPPQLNLQSRYAGKQFKLAYRLRKQNYFSNKVEQTAWQILEDGLVSCIASDMHSIKIASVTCY